MPASWGAGFLGSVCRSQHSQRRLRWAAVLSPPGLTWPEEASSGVAQGPPGPMQPMEALGIWCSGPLAPAQPEESLAAAGPRPRTQLAGRGPFGVARRLLGPAWPVGASGGGGSVLGPLALTWPEEDLSWVADAPLGPTWPVEALGCGSTQVYWDLPGQRSLSGGGAQAQEPRYRRFVRGGGWAPETHVALGGFGVWWAQAQDLLSQRGPVSGGSQSQD